MICKTTGSVLFIWKSEQQKTCTGSKNKEGRERICNNFFVTQNTLNTCAKKKYFS